MRYSTQNPRLIIIQQLLLSFHCWYSNNAETNEIIKTSWAVIANKMTPDLTKNALSIALSNRVKAAVVEAFHDKRFIP